MPTTSIVRFRSMFAGLRSTRRKYKASGYLREHIARFNKVSADSVKIDSRLNDYIMGKTIANGDELEIEINKTGGMVNVKLAGAPAATAAKAAPTAKSAKPSAQPAENNTATAAKSKQSPESKPSEPKALKSEKPKAEEKHAAQKHTEDAGKK